ncbi:peptidoglycan editing factor PgeF [Tissierella sp. MSJ-40]|uniref:Purine nucleoside phosphorylase n=1 Tax=Tissierella simiarum TaxID=2841534 RepID=A0ABS6E5G8_9FIRM|nr:peptidoglycan editing factor PgeF [Tissierella simiarum]MBU5438163.1 peptidoglycan editing factor PgeF [Tissierella simiarum]
MGISSVYRNEILYYEIEELKNTNLTEHLFSTRIGWEQDKLFSNLSKIFNVSEEKIFSTKQVHGIDILIIDNDNINSRDLLKEEIDGIITNIPGIILTTYHADCVPIYFLDTNKKVIALAHAGWKGTLNNIGENIIKNMIKYYSSDPQDIMAVIGPSIGPCCYEVGKDVEELFLDRYPNYDSILIKRGNKIYLDLWKVNRTNLENSGIKKENIYSTTTCTSCNTHRFYSYRKEKGIKNRMIAAIMLKVDEKECSNEY